MEILRTNFPYGLIKKSKNLISGAPIGTNSNPVGRSGKKNNRCHNSGPHTVCLICKQNKW